MRETANQGTADKAPKQGPRAGDPLPWWKNPGLVVFSVTMLLAFAGWMLVFRATQRIPVEEATLGGLHLRLDKARWILDQMDHGENFQKPLTMMPGMPEWGKQRVTLDLTFENHSERVQTYDGREFYLVPELRDEVPSAGAHTGRAELMPGQTFNTTIHFDLDTTLPHGKLRVAWRRDGGSVFLPIPEPPEHYHLRPRGGDASLPPSADLLLPIGRPERGEQLFQTVYGCVACHGDPKVPGSNNVGPHLAAIGEEAANRIEGMPPAQYIYESILKPGAFIAPECKDGRPCSEPTAMPEYASLMELQDIADLLAYLLEQRG